MQLRAVAAGPAPDEDARSRARSASTKLPPSRLPRPSLRQSRRLTSFRFIFLRLSSRRLYSAALILENKFRRIQKRPQNIFGRLTATGSLEGAHAHIFFFGFWQPAVYQKVKLIHDLGRRFLERGQNAGAAAVARHLGVELRRVHEMQR